MFNWFQRLLPRTGDFFGMFEAHAVTLVGAAEALSKLVDGGTPRRNISARSTASSTRPTTSSARCCGPSARPS